MDFSKIKTYSAQARVNLVTVDNMMPVVTDGKSRLHLPELDELAGRIVAARENGRPVILSMGAHVIKNGLSDYLIALIRRGYITHLAGNGACSIHDFELGYLGGTSEDVPAAIEDGSFGMWEETGGWMNSAIQQGYAQKLGYGEALGKYISEHPAQFPFKEKCVLYHAYTQGIPATYHIAIGTDIIHQHPSADFAAIGYTSGEDFKKMAQSVCDLQGGVYLNFGSSVIGPEVFLKALCISRNLGYQTFDITTANFDLVDLQDYRCKIGYDDPNYYYRPRKNIVNRPTNSGGKGWHFVLDHKQSIPELLNLLIAKGRANYESGK